MQTLLVRLMWIRWILRIGLLPGLVMVALVAGAGCRRDSGAGEAREEGPGSLPSALAERQRQLALVPLPAGTRSTPADSLIGELQRRARQRQDQVEPWLLLGNAWARKARESSDPGYYLQADACADVALSLE